MIRYAVIIASDKCHSGEREDSCSDVIKNLMERVGNLELTKILPDEILEIENILCELCDNDQVDLILTSGGTGFSPRDVTPEATRSVLEKTVPGIGEAMRTKSMEVTPRAMLSRGVAGIRKKTLIINLPGSPKAVKECLDVILPALPHGIDILRERARECGSL